MGYQKVSFEQLRDYGLSHKVVAEVGGLGKAIVKKNAYDKKKAHHLTKNIKKSKKKRKRRLRFPLENLLTEGKGASLVRIHRNRAAWIPFEFLSITDVLRFPNQQYRIVSVSKDGDIRKEMGKHYVDDVIEAAKVRPNFKKGKEKKKYPDGLKPHKKTKGLNDKWKAEFKPKTITRKKNAHVAA